MRGEASRDDFCNVRIAIGVENTNSDVQERHAMRLTSFTDIGFRALMRLASAPDRAFSTAEIADEFKLSRHHLAKAIAVLANAGLVESRRGGGGGVQLGRPADQIRLGDVVRILEEGQPLVECFAAGNGCSITPVCCLKHYLGDAKQAFLEALDQHTLADCTLAPLENSR